MIVTEFITKNAFKHQFLKLTKNTIDKLSTAVSAAKDLIRKRRHQKQVLRNYWETIKYRLTLYKKSNKMKEYTRYKGDEVQKIST